MVTRGALCPGAVCPSWDRWLMVLVLVCAWCCWWGVPIFRFLGRFEIAALKRFALETWSRQNCTFLGGEGSL